MLKRTITAIILIGILIPLIAIRNLLYVSYGFFGLLAVFGTYEIARLLKDEKKVSLVLSCISTTVLYVCGLLAFEIGPLFLIGLSALLLPLITLCFDKNLNHLLHRFLSILYPGIGFLAISYLRHQDARLVVYLFAITLTTDTFALFYGLLFGKNRLAPKISPKKTWEGALGGSLIGTLVAGIFATMYGVLFDNNFQTIFDGYRLFAMESHFLKGLLIFVISLLLTFVSQFGDLFASKIKRTYDVKDYSNILPGHGGIMDRFDSVTMTAIFLAIFVILI